MSKTWSNLKNKLKRFLLILALINLPSIGILNIMVICLIKIKAPMVVSKLNWLALLIYKLIIQLKLIVLK